MVPGAPAGEDSEIIRRCLAGEERALRELMARYERPVFSLALRMLRQREDAEDVTQETFVRVFRALDRYDTARPFAAWLFTIASRLCIDHMRRRRVRPIALVRREVGSQEDEIIDVPDLGPGPETLAQEEQEERNVQALIDTLPPHYRIVVVMRHQQDLSYEEIASALHLPLGTVKARIHRARALLAERVGGRGE
jgi:RNA polymerase sigma-70 factor (ECF subfamily)